MILQALCEYYDRKKALKDGEIEPFGFSREKIPVIIELKNDGSINQIEINENDQSEIVVPQGVKKSKNIVSNLFWGNPEYTLGIEINNTKERVKKQHNDFVQKIKNLPEPASSDEGVISLIKFLDNLDKFLSSFNIQKSPSWELIQKNKNKNKATNISFRLLGDNHLICQRTSIIQTIKKTVILKNGNKGICLITGNKDFIERTHPPIKGVWGAQSGRGKIVSFNKDSFNSFNNKQGNNSPVGEETAFKYTATLNYLLNKDSKQHIQVGDASTVFWAKNNTNFVDSFSAVFSSTLNEIKDDPDKYTGEVTTLFESIKRGIPTDNIELDKFYVLGLSPNVARISIRFWCVSTVNEMAHNIKRHFEYLDMIPQYDNDIIYLPLFSLLRDIAVLGKSKNIPPNLAGEIMRSILTGQPYPFTLLSATVRRCKSERKINHPRAAIIKACLNSNRSKHEGNLKMSLDTKNTNSGYRLGRLFAVLEKTQEEADPNRNATIKDCFYGAASSNPISVFPTLLRRHNHHLKKLEFKGRKVKLEKQIGEIMNDISDFPTNLTLQDQGRFAVGYYHQRQHFFTKTKTDSNETGDQS